MLERWRERDVFHESIRRREGAPPFVFYEGPPTANGRPGSHHVLAASSRTSSRATRRCVATSSRARPAGTATACRWSSRSRRSSASTTSTTSSASGSPSSTRKCRESVLRYIDEWNELTERIGFWIDTDDAYFTLDPNYIESVWWSLKQVWEKGLLVEGNRVVPYCTRCGTALSSHELALGYKDVVDPSVFVKFPLVDEPGRLAARLDDDAVDARAARGDRGRPGGRPTCAPACGDDRLILAEALVERVLGEDAEIVERMPGLRAARPALRAAVPVHHGLRRARPHGPGRATSSRSRTAPAWCTPARPSARTTSGSPPRTG